MRTMIKKNEEIRHPVVTIAEPFGPICLPNKPAIQKPVKDKKTNGIYIYGKNKRVLTFFFIFKTKKLTS